MGGFGGYMPSLSDTSKEIQVKYLLDAAKEYNIDVDIDVFAFVMKKVYGDANGIIDSIIPHLTTLLDKYSSKVDSKEEEA